MLDCNASRRPSPPAEGVSTIPRIHVPSTGPDDWKSLLADPATQWKRGHSAMAAALSWEAAADGLPPEIAALFDDEPELLLALPEHKVALPGGRASQCDVFALVRTGGQTLALAVEAKVHEPFGPSVGDWLRDASTGKLARMRFLCDLLGLSDAPPTGLRYQLLHRTAAAALEAERFKTDRAGMIVQSFCQNHRWFKDFEDFARLMGAEAAPGAASVVRLPSGRPLMLGWAVGSKDFI
ncbi:hypothetical protein P2H44_14035 [Albimonas sp. CAU 1670]|uniref:DUF6946 family protein n=1 Tax=Albimonas sp. CAU 1670 TaxID=3032599 RepID=UPI0023DB7BF1|nr:hypothetical protein [Albimonas sp. CAU 1670]MDF2233676.1 hypothetical protein [Albimonas sp. CAU 1670]